LRNGGTWSGPRTVDIGIGKSFMDGEWTSPDLVALSG
jgi:hypothetical protein